MFLTGLGLGAEGRTLRSRLLVIPVKHFQTLYRES